MGASWDWRALTKVAVREARRLLGNREEAEDAAQEAILRAYRSRGRCASPEAPAAWVQAIARNESYRLISRRSPVTPLEEAREPGSEDHAEMVADRLLARSALKGVSTDDRHLLLRRYVLDQTSTQIAEELAVPAATVRVRLHRAGSRIRARLEAA